MRRADQFVDDANLVRDLADEGGETADVYVTLCVHAGIAASDVICCARLGEHAKDEDHNEGDRAAQQGRQGLSQASTHPAEHEDEGWLQPHGGGGGRRVQAGRTGRRDAR